jgi:hypothetical protein
MKLTIDLSAEDYTDLITCLSMPSESPEETITRIIRAELLHKRLLLDLIRKKEEL